jgi:tetratricopeptide (TPR) repeat protein
MATAKTPSYLDDGGLGISRLIEVDRNFTLARALIRQALRRFPDHHWLYSQMGLSYALQENFRKALHYTRQALGIAPRCPLTLWYHACILHNLDQSREAAAVFTKLLRRGVAGIATGPCGEGLRRAEGMVNDCRAKLAILSRNVGKKRRAARLFREHLAGRKAGVRSVFTRKAVENMLAEIVDGH